jgi:hypothetical protein
MNDNGQTLDNWNNLTYVQELEYENDTLKTLLDNIEDTVAEIDMKLTKLKEVTFFLTSLIEKR